MPVKPTPANANAGRSAQPLKFDPTTVGGTGLKQTAGYIHEEFLRELAGQRGMRKFREMAENDYVCGAFLFAIETLIRGVEWTVQPADDTSEAEDGATFAEEVFADMRTSFDAMLSEICTMFTYGHAPMEITWKRRTSAPDEMGLPQSKFDDGKIGVRSIALRGQETIINWDIDDEDGTILGLHQQPWNRTSVYIPMAKLLLFRTSAVKNNPEGRSILRTAYRSWYFKNKIEEIEAIGVERDLAGLPVVRIPQQFMAPDATPDDKRIYEAYKQLVTRIRRDQQEGIVLPSTKDKEGEYLFTLELLSTGGSRSFDTNKVLTRYDRAVATAVLADFIFLGQQAVGSFALSSDKTALFAAAIQSFLNNSIAKNLNENLLPRLWHLNGLPVETMPKLVPADIEEASLTEVMAVIGGMAAAGAPMFPDRELENALRKRAGLPPAPEDGPDMPTPLPPAGADGQADPGADQADMSE